MRSTHADAQRLEQMEDAILRLREAAETASVLVEGARDIEALAWLGIGGHHVALNVGRPLLEVVDGLAHDASPVVLLVDWDRTGGRLAQRLLESLRGRVPVDEDARRRLAAAFRSRSVEEIPAELTALRRAVQGGRP